jgi:hypothetical protein
MFERANFIKGKNIDELTVFHCSSLVDEIWVPTSWHEHIMRAELQKLGFPNPQIYVVPEAVNTRLFDSQRVRDREQKELSRTQEVVIDMEGNAEVAPAAQKTGEDKNKPFQFLSIFKWELRKGWDVLLRAYWSAFKPDDNVLLRIRSYIPEFNNDGGDKNITNRIASFAEKEYGKALHELVSVMGVSCQLYHSFRDCCCDAGSHRMGFGRVSVQAQRVTNQSRDAVAGDVIGLLCPPVEVNLVYTSVVCLRHACLLFVAVVVQR